MAELKATIRISTTSSGGWQFEVDDAQGQPYAMGGDPDFFGVMCSVTAHVETLAYEDPIVIDDPTDEEYAAEVARAKVEFQKKQIVTRSGVR